MIGILDFILKQLGRLTEAASATGSALAKMKEVLDNRITTTIVGRIDAALSSLPSASDYTSGRAARLDEAGIKSIQNVSGTWPTSNATLDITISSVNTAKAKVYIRSLNYGTSNNPGSDHPQGFSFPNATTLRVMRGQANSSTPSWYGTVVETN